MEYSNRGASVLWIPTHACLNKRKAAGFLSYLAEPMKTVEGAAHWTEPLGILSSLEKETETEIWPRRVDATKRCYYYPLSVYGTPSKHISLEIDDASGRQFSKRTL